MLKRGWEALGVDPYPRGAATLEPLRSRVISGRLDAVGGEEFDAVTAIEVLEHIPDYPDLLEGMVTLLRPGGILVVTVPNDWNFQPVPGPEGRVEPKYGHLWRFSASELESDLTRSGGNAVVREIYSRHLDHRLYRYSRVLTGPMSQRLSARLVARHDDGAWLLGSVVGRKEFGQRTAPGEVKPSARSYRDDPLFGDPLPE
jgi:SAM-dependent methyltransferase